MVLDVTAIHYPDYGAVFIHIPKTGGRSVRIGALARLPQEKYLGPFPEHLKDEFVFAFSRHPIDRFLSAYRMICQGTRNYGENYMPKFFPMPVEEFAEIALSDERDYHPFRTMEGWIQHHTEPQWLPTRGLEHADFIGRYESLAVDFGWVTARLGLDIELPKLNISRGEKPALSQDLTRRLTEFYKTDFEAFGYDAS